MHLTGTSACLLRKTTPNARYTHRTFLAQQRIAAHRRRWRQRHAMACTRSVADVASTLVRISREYPDAPQPLGRTGIVSILAKMYADGAAFAENRQRDIETVGRRQHFVHYYYSNSTYLAVVCNLRRIWGTGVSTIFGNIQRVETTCAVFVRHTAAAGKRGHPFFCAKYAERAE